jgi:hypothetical protein
LSIQDSRIFCVRAHPEVRIQAEFFLVYQVGEGEHHHFARHAVSCRLSEIPGVPPLLWILPNDSKQHVLRFAYLLLELLQRALLVAHRVPPVDRRSLDRNLTQKYLYRLVRNFCRKFSSNSVVRDPVVDRLRDQLLPLAEF